MADTPFSIIPGMSFEAARKLAEQAAAEEFSDVKLLNITTF